MCLDLYPHSPSSHYGGNDLPREDMYRDLEWSQTLCEGSRMCAISVVTSEISDSLLAHGLFLTMYIGVHLCFRKFESKMRR